MARASVRIHGEIQLLAHLIEGAFRSLKTAVPDQPDIERSFGR